MANYKIRKRYAAKVAKVLALIMTIQALAPMQLMALTSGPTQPEFSEFEPVGTTQMVDLFSGDFVYNIPLFELPGPDGGYPFNLSYHSGITMDQEATWVGLGWTLNHGAITRTMRGLPDDFNGERVERKMSMEPNRTWRYGLSAHRELVAFDTKKAEQAVASVSGDVAASFGLKVSVNNYRGIGLSTSLGLSSRFIQNKKEGTYKGTRGKANLNLSFGSEEGANLGGSFSIGDVEGKNNASLAFNKNGREGVNSFSLGYTRAITTKKAENKDSKEGSKKGLGAPTISPSASYTYSKNSYSPQVTMPYRGKHFTASLEAGAYAGLFLGLGPQFDVSFNRQRIKYNNKWVQAPAYGYLYLRTRGLREGLADFNREKDGPIDDHTTNLASPVSTPDIYSVMGQGTGGMYRAYRSELGTFTDPKINSLTGGGTLGLDANAFFGVDGGLDIGGNFGLSYNGDWRTTQYGFVPSNFRVDVAENPKTTRDFESYFFKAAGEMTAEPLSNYDFMGQDELLSLQIAPSNGDFNAPNVLVANDGSILQTGTNPTNFAPLGQTDYKRPNRKPRANSIQPITNAQLLGPNEQESLNEYKIGYYELDNNGAINFDVPLTPLQRNANKPFQVAGITALQPNGMRYVYGLPVINTEHHEVSFSVAENLVGNPPVRCDDMFETTSDYIVAPGGNEIEVPTDAVEGGNYLNHTKMPEYAHTHLLTSVLGADYVDLGEPGPSDDDYGYWVKFNYVKTNSENNPYIWKTPFEGANFMPGNFADRADDKGMIVAGKREQYYLASAETRTHLAVFDIEARDDARGATGLFQTQYTESNTSSAYSYKLRSIKLYSKLELANNPNTYPIKTVVFKYSGDNNSPYQTEPGLCPGIENGSSGNGKLTLRSVHFEYENSNRGAFSPYEFNYGNLSDPLDNPPYSLFNYDRWGTYRNITDICEKFSEPYSVQDKTIADQNAKAWNLRSINLPSGASIEVDYESDDYAYVQDEVAMQMFEINDTDGNQNDHLLSLENTGLAVTFSYEGDNTDPLDYVNGLHGVEIDATGQPDFSNAQVYFKIFTELNNSDNFDYVEGYARVANIIPAGGNSARVILRPEVINGKSYHPFQLAAWQYLKAVYPQGAMDGVDLDNSNENNFKDALDDLGAAFGQAKAIFSDFYTYCDSENFGQIIDPGKSYIRLCSPDRIKMGGGCRVQKIVLHDNWDIGEDGLETNDTPTYGQYFDYTKEIKDENGNVVDVISSGVAVNEPAIGYEECALRYAKFWTLPSFLSSSEENIIFEYPINESYYPGASVGYSKVTVKSLATHYAMNPADAPGNLPSGFGTTGLTVNEFYTAKDFPVITEETIMNKFPGKPKQLFLGLMNMTSDLFTASQGYKITLNDMHGKPYKVTHYGLDDGNNIIDQKLSEVIYTYKEGERLVNEVGKRRKSVRTLDNVVSVLEAPFGGVNDPNAVVSDQLMGVNYETFIDMRESGSVGGEAFVGINAKFTPTFLFALAAWPSLDMNQSKTRTAVVNKIIRKSGILIKTDAYDGQSHITTTNDVFDPLTGEPLLTSVNNSFDDKIYNYNIPARMSYDRMGAAYENWGMQFSASLGVDEGCGYFSLSNFMGGNPDDLIPGDELIMTSFYDENNTCNDFPGLCEHRKFIYVGYKNNQYLFENKSIGDVTLGTTVNFMISRSGNRNHLSAKAGNIAALNNPMENRQVSGPYTLNVKSPGFPGAFDINYNIRTINKVLNASAVTYEDAWDLERDIVNNTLTINIPGGEPIYGTQNCILVLIQREDTGYCESQIGPGTSTKVDYTVNGSPTSTTVPGVGVPIDAICEIGTIVVTNVELLNVDPSCYTYSSQVFSEEVQIGVTDASQRDVVMSSSEYEIGQLGIWRPHKSFSYVDDRTPFDLTNTSTEVDIRNDGICNNFVLFDWANPFFPQFTEASKWKQTNEITKYSRNGEEVENRDIIGLYSTAHYGYKDNLPVAVAANASYHEIGFEGFEEAEIGGFPDADRTGGFDIFCNQVTKKANLTYNILGAYDGGLNVWIDKEYYPNIPLPDNVFLLVKDENGNEYEAAAGISNITSVNPTTAGLNTFFRDNICLLKLEDVQGCDLVTGVPLTGRVVLQYEHIFPALFTCYSSITNEAAHSGKHSMKVTSSSSFTQKSLQLITGKSYVISAWVKSSNTTPVFEYSSSQVNLGIDGQTFPASGKMIEGWQRIEGVFTYSGGNMNLSFNVPSGTPFYFDDLRIYPEDGSIQTYVYNPEDYRLQAVLDQNNYATFYSYDEEGNLFLIKKETAKGIKTIQETREYVKIAGQ